MVPFNPFRILCPRRHKFVVHFKSIQTVPSRIPQMAFARSLVVLGESNELLSPCLNGPIDILQIIREDFGLKARQRVCDERQSDFMLRNEPNVFWRDSAFVWIGDKKPLEAIGYLNEMMVKVQLSYAKNLNVLRFNEWYFIKF